MAEQNSLESHKVTDKTPPESPTYVLVTLAIIGFALIFLASIGDVLIRLVQIGGYLTLGFVIVAVGARVVMDEWPPWAVQVTDKIRAWWESRRP